MPTAPEGYRYDMTKSPPELVRRRKAPTSSSAANQDDDGVHRNTTPKTKPSEEQQVDLLRSDYSNPIRTDETFYVPQRYTHLPRQQGSTSTNGIAPCTNPATYVDVSHFPAYFKTDDEACSVYNQMGVRLKIQFKKHALTKNEYGETTMFHLVCHKRGQHKKKVNQGLNLKSTILVDCPF